MMLSIARQNTNSLKPLHKVFYKYCRQKQYTKLNAKVDSLLQYGTVSQIRAVTNIPVLGLV